MGYGCPKESNAVRYIQVGRSWIDLRQLVAASGPWFAPRVCYCCGLLWLDLCSRYRCSCVGLPRHGTWNLFFALDWRGVDGLAVLQQPPWLRCHPCLNELTQAKTVLSRLYRA